MTRPEWITALAALLLAGSAPACAQTLERRVAQAGDRPVEFHFAARAGVCGDGRSYFRADDDGWYGTFSSDGWRAQPCERGPVRVVIVRAGREVVKVETYAGPLQRDPGAAQDLGAVGAREAAMYLLSVAASAEGRPARDALTPAMLAESTAVTPLLLAIAKDQGRGRDLRKSAISWLARRRAEPGGVGAAGIARALDQIVRDRSENESVRQTAMSTISRFDRGEGVPTLIGFAGDGDRWISRRAFQMLARSGDPRARQFIRDAVKRADLEEESRIEAIRGIGGEHSTGADLKLLRDLYPSLNSDRERDALIQAVATAGGSENATWLLGIARSSTEPVQRRRRAVSLLSKFDDPRVKEALKDLIDRRP
ncbi:MAG TPA: HEAT repeat domain-containing protein [Gemmatimonadaceae bacterium]|nr:HEAT repeat domain-containing protein [Gemmatimonadaceae bacterium]